MRYKWLRAVITSVGLAAAALHLVYPLLAVDAVTVTLLLVAVLPWLQPLFKSLELPGGVKVEFQDFEKVAKRAEAAGLLASQPPAMIAQPAFLQVAPSDPNLALAGLRIELERRLETLARSRGATDVPKGIGRLLQFLNQHELIGGQEREVLSDLVGLLNRAVHGASIDSDVAAWALDIGPRILSALDQRTAGPGVQYDGIIPKRLDARPH